MKLKWLPLALIIAVSFSSQPTMAVRWATHQDDKPPANVSLQLTTSLLRLDLCEDGEMRIWLRLRYTNTGEEPIILDRFSASFSRYTISHSEEAAAKRKYETVVNIFNLYTVLNPTRGPKPPEESFVILAPGQSHEIDTMPDGRFLLMDSSDVGRYRKGNHVMQVSVPTWFESTILAKELSVGWRKYGVLWWQGITSQPMPFKIEKPTSTINCS